MTQSVEDTIALGRRIGTACPAGTCIALHGPLGAGKTQLVRGIALGAQVADPDLVASPTYVLLNVYEPTPGAPGAKTVYHLDAYRAHGVEDFEAVGLEEILGDEAREGGIVVIEWPSRIPELLPADHLAVEIEAGEETVRVFRISGTGPRAQALAAALGA